MSRTLRAIIIAVSLIVAGSILAGCSLFAMDGTWDLLSDMSKLSPIAETISQDFSNIDIAVCQTDVALLPSPDGSCYYKAEIYDNMPCTVNVENGTLTVRQQDNWRWYQYIGFFPMQRNASLEIYLPMDAYERLGVTGATSDITITNGFTFTNAGISNSTGDIDFAAKVTGELMLDCTTGDVLLQDTSADSIDISCTTGDVRISDISTTYLSARVSTGRIQIVRADIADSLVAKATTGDLQLSLVDCESLNLTTTTGDGVLAQVIAGGNAVLHSNNGDWEFAGFDAADIQVETSTGDVVGSLLSDKIFLVDTTTGRTDVPQTTSGGICQITTTTGDVRIHIAP